MPWRLHTTAAPVLLAALLAATPLDAHESPDEKARRLSAEIARRGGTPELLCRRATELRVYGRTDAAVADLHAALRLDPTYVPALIDLARIETARSRTTEALAAVNHALDHAPAAVRPELLMIRAELFEAKRDRPAALRDCDEAISSAEPAEDWFLARARIQLALGRQDDAARGLSEGFRRNGSAVLETEWVECLIDAGKPAAALPVIERNLAEVRLKSSWLIRRARANLSAGKAPTARPDLLEALDEIETRLSPTRPDLTLLAERGLARALLGNTEAARADLERVRRAGATGWMLIRLESALRPTSTGAK